MFLPNITLVTLVVLLYYTVQGGMKTNIWETDVIGFAIAGIAVTSVYFIFFIVECACMNDSHCSKWFSKYLDKISKRKKNVFWELQLVF